MKKIFIKSVNWVGDAVLVTPAIRAVRRTWPDAEITLLARPWVADVFEANPDIDRLWVAAENASRRHFRDIVGRIRNEQFDIGIVLPNSFGAAMLMWRGHIRRRVGYRRDARHLLLTDAVPVTPEILRIHQVEYYLNLLRDLCDLSAHERKLVVPVAPDARDFVREVLRRQGLGDTIDNERPLVALSPGAAFGTAKRWLPERFAAVADYLTENYNARVVAVGSPGERPISESVAKAAAAPVTILNGLFPLRGLIALCDELRLMITNDSGNMHLAAARKTPLIAIFGPTDWTTTAPYDPDAILVRKPTECAPCMKRHCPRKDNVHICMRNVLVQDVIDAVDQQMRKAPPQKP